MNNNECPSSISLLAPKAQGLYDPSFEHDSCGVGFVVDIKGRKSRKIIQDALTILVNLRHRGACGAELNTGDGAGILFQMPHLFFKETCLGMGMKLPGPKEYGVGMIFLPQDSSSRKACEKIFEEIVKEEGQTVLGWRTVMTDNSPLGSTARRGEPFIRQIFVGSGSKIKDVMSFERKLYVIRKRVENAIRYSKNNIPGKDYFYVLSLSCRTIVYKGMLMSEQVSPYFMDLAHPAMESALALVHSRFSTNTFPSWDRAHPYRYVAHNGEINTIRGNVNWMFARQAMCESDLFGGDIKKLLPIIAPDGSDSAMFDNCVEFLVLAGRSLPHTIMMMIPEPWSNNETISDARRSFYEFHSCLMEPWDGPASIAFTDGEVIGAVLDRNGLRPSRYYVTKDDVVIMASEVGVLDVAPERIFYKGKLEPGRMFLVDAAQGRIVNDEELKEQMAVKEPYHLWLKDNLVHLGDLPEAPKAKQADHESILFKQKMFGYSYEDIRTILLPMAKNGIEPLGSMGTDTPLAVLSQKPQLLYNYFKQLFAQVTNPPIDAIREKIVTSTETTIGPERNILDPKPESSRQIKMKTPILTNEEFSKLQFLDHRHFKSVTLPMLYEASLGSFGLGKALDTICQTADEAIREGANILILSDRGYDEKSAPLPALLAISGLHHHLIRQGTRTRVGLVLESGEPREVHHFAVLLGYGVGAVNPYLAFETLDDMISQGLLVGIDHKMACKNYLDAVTKGIVKTMSKMGISTIRSYRGAQIFEAIGLNKSMIDKYFTWTPSRLGGIGIEEIAQEVGRRHESALSDALHQNPSLDTGGQYRWRKDGEQHLFNPDTIHKLQMATRKNDYALFKDYSQSVNDISRNLCTLRGLLDFDFKAQPIPIEEVESVEEIMKRFKTGAMSYGSISQEAHESLAIAMNRIGGKSNTGEGGEDPERFKPLPNGDSKNSAIKQVASGRFGVTSHYLVNARELQIKMAQGAKPGEGGQLPGGKVYPWIAKTRHSTPGVGLISPPPHHDIYSIEDLAELIRDLKNANRYARISVKLVSEVGVGTIAAGVAKAHADVVLISGYDGGTGASPLSSIKHAGAPWELGLAETHQTLLLNDLRSRVVVEVDGQLKTGRDVVIAALLGAEEFGFATAPLVVLGCVMMRVCHLNTCPVGVATQDPELRKKFSGNPDFVVNFMRFIAEEVREYMAKLGFRSINNMIGRTDRLRTKDAVEHWKVKGLDFSHVLYKPQVPLTVGRYCQIGQDHGIENTLDYKILLDLCEPALERKEKVEAALHIYNTNRVVGTILGSEVTRRYGAEGLREDTVHLHFTGSAGQSFGAFVPKGITMELEGDANDYIGKGLSGGKIIVYPPKNSTFAPKDNVIVGNVSFYGATNGEAYIYGMAGERFCVRNSGVHAVVEAVGDHGCEYMTGGKVVVLGRTGKNFAAGMSGGIAYIFDPENRFPSRCNRQMVELFKLEDDKEIGCLKQMIENHLRYTSSRQAKFILDNWEKHVSKFVKVYPTDYRNMLESIERAKHEGLDGEKAVMTAFEENSKKISRVSGD